MSVTGSPVITPTGELQGIVLVARDIRELRQLLADKEAESAPPQGRGGAARREGVDREQLEEARKQLLLAERRATLGTLAGGVGHELRNIAQIQIAAIDELATALEAGRRRRGWHARSSPSSSASASTSRSTASG